MDAAHEWADPPHSMPQPERPHCLPSKVVRTIFLCEIPEWGRPLVTPSPTHGYCTVTNLLL